MYRFFKAVIITAVVLLILPVACKKKDNPTTPAEPTATFTFTFTFTQTGTPYSHTMTPTLTFTPTVTSSPTNTSTLTLTSTFTDTLTPTVTSTPTDTLTPTDTFTPTVTSTPTAFTLVDTYAGQVGVEGSTNGNALQASFYFPTGVAVDASGNVYVADNYNNLIRKITSGGVVSTLAASTNPNGVAVDTLGNVYVTEDGGNIKKITSEGVVTILATSFNKPYGVAVDASGNVYVADSFNNLIRMITPGGTVTTFAGTGYAGSDNGAATTATFIYPAGVAVDASGNVYVADTWNNLIRKITSGVVTTLATSFNHPMGVAVDASGNVYVADSGNHRIRKITSGGVVTTEAGGSGNPGFANGFGPNAQFFNPTGVAVGTALYVADSNNAVIRVINPY
jgi:sugar lactone lactonase YvrE